MRTVALIGNPNSGKSTIFNALTRLRQKVGNYPGVTVEKKLGTTVLPAGEAVSIIDLPGTYSLAVRSPDEMIVREVLLGHVARTPRPDVVVGVIDATNLERNLYLVSQVLDLGLPVVLALNMMDEVKRLGKTIDVAVLAARLGVPVVPMVASRAEGIEDLKLEISRVAANGCRYERTWGMPKPMEEEVASLAQWLERERKISRSTAFAEAVLALSEADHSLSSADPVCAERVREARKRLGSKGVEWRTVLIEARYDWIHGLLEGVSQQRSADAIRYTDTIDAIVTHKVWGWVFFVLLMAFMFYAIFALASYPMGWIDQGFAFLSKVLHERVPPSELRDLLTDGILAGVGGVVVFMPQILILFFFIALLQDTGYMARAAFIMDRLMGRIGLHGKAFIPLLSSFACAIPGIMASRSMENSKDRLVTILIAPLMSCSARLPVYTLMIAAFLPGADAWLKVGLMLILYFSGVLAAVGMAWVFKKTILKGPTPPFIMELPPYRLPTAKTIFLHMWERGGLFLKKAGTVILAFSVILWAMMTYPQSSADTAADALRHSFAGQMGIALEPLVKPLGYDWRIAIGLVGSFAAREIFVSTMSIVFNMSDAASLLSLVAAFRQATWPDGQPLFTPLVCLSLMFFYVFAMQCVSSLVITYRETNSWKWPLLQFIYMTALAYGVSFLIYQGGRLLGWQ